MKRLFGICLVVLYLGASSVADSALETQVFFPPTAANQAETVDVFRLYFTDFFTAKVRLRNSSNSQQRIKTDRGFEIQEVPGLVFLTCKIAKSYSEIHIDKYLKLLFQYTIQVNAP